MRESAGSHPSPAALLQEDPTLETHSYPGAAPHLLREGVHSVFSTPHQEMQIPLLFTPLPPFRPPIPSSARPAQAPSEERHLQESL